ncbi:MAG TPA: phosphatase PAP2 family protein [Candidatus Saccharimonadales bacterium]|nr:phosphatase PAP2 family protein [Candidatus Saccharimonadales bacterium]
MSVSDIFVRLIADALVVPIVLVGAIAMLRLPASTRVMYIARGVFTGLLALLFASIASLLFQDGQRPFEQLGVSAGAAYLNNPGFPSDHALLVFVITFVVWASTRNKRLAVALLVMSCAVAFGRVVALVHTPADVLGGLACALLAAVLVYGKSFYSLKTKK